MSFKHYRLEKSGASTYGKVDTEDISAVMADLDGYNRRYYILLRNRERIEIDEVTFKDFFGNPL